MKRWTHSIYDVKKDNGQTTVEVAWCTSVLTIHVLSGAHAIW